MSDPEPAVAEIAPGRSVWEMVDARAGVTPDLPLISDDHGRLLTAAEFRDACVEMAATLVAAGVVPGCTVSWQLPTTVDAYVLTGALARLGCRQNPIVPILRHQEIGFIVDELGSDWLVTTGVFRGVDFGAMADEVAADRSFGVIRVGDLTGGDPAALPPYDALWAAHVGEHAANWVYYTSGTTGRPKGAQHTESSIIATSTTGIVGRHYSGTDVFPCAFPVTHIGGIMFLVTSLRVGLRIVCFDVFDPATTPFAMARHEPTVLGSALPFFRAYLAAQATQPDTPLFPHLRACGSGGAPTPPELHHMVKERLGAGITNAWGMTEFPMATSNYPDDPDEWCTDTVGRPAPGVSVRVVDLDGNDRTGDGGTGELRLDGPAKMVGYVDSSLDADAFDELGFLRTGDLGCIDADGNVRVTGRIKDVIIRNAENISAVEVENALFTHPAIADITVFGVPDPVTGERVCAVVVLADGHETVTIDDLADHCRSLGLAKQKVPERVETASALPRSPAGKVLKHVVRAELLESGPVGRTPAS